MRIAELNPGGAGQQADGALTRAERPLNWPLHAAFAATLVLFAALYAGTFASLVYTWAHDGTFEYAFLIFPVCAALVWLRRTHLQQTAGRPRPRALWLAIMLAGIWLIGAFADINLLMHFSVVAFIPTLVYIFYGPDVTRVLAFALGYMFFAVPFGDFMVGPLQDITAHLSVFVLQWTSVPVFMSGRIILTPASAWHVAEACSGVKFFIATTAFGVLYAHLFYQRLRRRLIFIACAMIVPIIANALRVFFTILIGEYFGVQYASGTDHMIFGWQFFGTVLLLLFLAGWPWHEADAAPSEPSTGSNGPALERRHWRLLITTAITVAVLIAGPVWLAGARAMTISPDGSTASMALPALDALQKRAPIGGVNQLGMVYAQADARRTAYYNGALPVRVDYARYDGAPGASHDLVTTGNRLFDPSKWRVVARRDAAEPGGMAQIELVKRNGRRQSSGRGASDNDSRWLMGYIYRVNDRTTTSTLVVKAWQAWYGLTARPLRSSVIAATVPASDRVAARRQLAEFRVDAP